MPTRSKTPALVTADMSVSDCLSAICQHNYDYLIQWESAARSWENIEGVHQIRVSFRRLRSALSVFRSAVPRSTSRFWADELRWLAGQLGPARDLDVFISEGLDAVPGLPPMAGADKARALAQSRRVGAYEQVGAMLDGERYRNFKEEFPRWVRLQPWRDAELNRKQRKNLGVDLVPFARGVLDRQERAVLMAGSGAHRDDAAEMHRLRIECKKLRYAAEFFQPLFDDLDDFLAHLRGLQDLLGVMNDVSVLDELLQGLLQGVTDVDTWQFAGSLLGWRTREYFDLKDSFEDRWEGFVHATHPWWKPPSARADD